MNEGITGSTVPRRQLGRHLFDLRKQSRLSSRTVAEQLEWSEAKIWRIESGQTGTRSLDVETMCRIYGAPPDLTQTLMGLARETKAKVGGTPTATSSPSTSTSTGSSNLAGKE